jgi:SAM-dependent methyltransferase
MPRVLRSPDDFDRRRSSFGAGADAYAAVRPSYPSELLSWVLGHVPKDVVDLGADTGILTAAVARLGHRVTGVEPDANMRAQAAPAIVDRLLPGRGEAIPLPDASVDAVVAGQAWHWFDVARVQAEVLRVLRPGGVIGVLWNLRDERVAWVRRLGDLVGGEDRTSVWDVNRELPISPSLGSAETRWARHEAPLARASP